MRAVFDWVVVRRVCLRLALTRDAAFDAGQRVNALGRDRLAADFAQDRGLPVRFVGGVGIDRTALEPLFFAERTGHLRGGLDQQRMQQVISRIRFAPQ